MAKRRLALLLALLATACLMAAYMLLFKAGCACDLKTGTSGDPTLALHLESLSLPPFLVGLGAATWFASGWTTQWRGTVALATFTVGGALLWLLGVQIEIWGTQACF